MSDLESKKLLRDQAESLPVDLFSQDVENKSIVCDVFQGIRENAFLEEASSHAAPLLPEEVHLIENREEEECPEREESQEAEKDSLSPFSGGGDEGFSERDQEVESPNLSYKDSYSIKKLLHLFQAALGSL